MKTIKLFFNILLITSTVFLLSCKEDEHGPVLTKISASTLDDIAFSPIFKLQEPSPGSNPVLFTLTWTETLFYLDGSASPMPVGPISYKLEMDVVGNNFSNPKVIAAAKDAYADIHVVDMNSILLDQYKYQAGAPVNMELRIITEYGLNNPDYQVVSTNTLPITLTPYKPTSTKISNIYIIGDMNGWNNNGTEFVMYRNNSEAGNSVYTYTGWIATNTYFKFCAEENLGGWSKMYCILPDGKIELADGDAFQIANEGFYTITIDTKEMTYSIGAYDASSAKTYTKMCAVGAFCNWGDGGSDPEMKVSSYDGHQWSLVYTFDSQTSCKFRENHDWTNNWGGKETAFPYGIAVYNDQESTTVAPGKYKIYFNDLTGHYVFVAQ